MLPLITKISKNDTSTQFEVPGKPVLVYVDFALMERRLIQELSIGEGETK